MTQLQILRSNKTTDDTHARTPPASAHQPNTGTAHERQTDDKNIPGASAIITFLAEAKRIRYCINNTIRCPSTSDGLMLSGHASLHNHLQRRSTRSKILPGHSGQNCTHGFSRNGSNIWFQLSKMRHIQHIQLPSLTWDVTMGKTKLSTSL